MNPVSIETDYWSSTTATPRSGAGNGDLFAELLRQHSDAQDPAPRRDAARESTGRGWRRDTARDLDRREPAPADDRTDHVPTADAAPARSDETAPVAEADPAPESETAAAPADEAAQDETTRDDGETPAIPAVATATPADAVPGAAEPTPVAVAPAPNATAPLPAAAPTAGEAAPNTPALPADATAAAPAPAATPAADDAAQPAVAQTASTVAPAVVAPPRPAATPAAGAAHPVDAAATDTEFSTDLQSDALDPMAENADGDMSIQVKRADPAATAPQGLGKLGSGAEVALAAQANVRALRDAAAPAAASAGPQPATPAQPVTGTQAQGADAAPPATATPAAPAAQQATVQPQPGTAIPVAAAFQAALDSASADANGTPGTSSGAIAAGSLQGATGAGTAPAVHGRQTPVPGTPAEQLAVHVQRAVRDGNSRITVQLNPVELGQVEVRLDFAKDGSVSATILADRHDTLDMLQRDARHLERSLQDAGLQTNSGSLSFDLRDGGRQGFGSQTAARGDDGGRGQPRPETDTATNNDQAGTRRTGSDTGVDIHV